jgi:hypothetical protein
LGLSVGQRRLVARVASVAGVRHVGAMLICRGCFDEALHRYAARYGEAPALRAIRSRLFGETTALRAEDLLPATRDTLPRS